MDLKEKASYLMGLLEGSKLDFDKEENKIVKTIAVLLKEISEKVHEIDGVCEENSALIDELDEDLANIEKDFYSGGNNFKKHCHCGEHGENDLDGKEQQEFEKEGEYEISCPNCGRVVELNDDIFEKDDILCPDCGKRIDFEFKEDIDEE